jgi:membrane protein
LRRESVAGSIPGVERLRVAVRVLAKATTGFHRDRGFDRAAVIAYFALLSFLPLAVLLVAIGARALGSVEAAERGTEILLGNVLVRLPPQLMKQVRLLQEEIWSGLLYLPLLLWSASKVFAKVEGGLDAVFQVEVRRPWALRKVLSFAVVAVLSVLLVALVVLSGILGTADRFIDSTALAPLRDTTLYRIMDGLLSRYLAPWLLTVGSFALVYKLVPAVHVPARAAVSAGVVAGTLWEWLKIGFTYYVSQVASYGRTYGALEAIVVFLLWVNLSAALLLWGGELAAVLTGNRLDQGGSG